MKRLNLTLENQFENIKKKIENVYNFKEGDLEIEKTISLLIDNFDVDDNRNGIIRVSTTESAKTGKTYTTKWLVPCSQEILDLSVYFYYIANRQRDVCRIGADYDTFNLFVSALKFINYYDNISHSLCTRAADIIKFYKDLEINNKKSKDYLYILFHFKKLYMNRFKIRNSLKNIKDLDAEEEKEREIALQQTQYKDYLQSIGMWGKSIYD